MTEQKQKKIDFGFEDIPIADKQDKVGEIFSSVAPKYDLMNDAMSFGMHRLWKRYLIKLAGIKPNQHICDLASGTGDVALLLTRELGDTGGKVVMSDINKEMLDIGYDKIFDAGLSRVVEPVVANSECLPFASSSFDLVTMVFGLRNITDKKRALSEMHRIVKPGGTVLVMEFSKPKNSFVSYVYDKYSFNVIPGLGRFFAGDSESYRYLVESIRRHPDQEKLQEWFYEAGFDSCSITNLSSGVVAVHKGVKY
ncbi:MAG: bifunctional demethylmenaquinone methyltransferase/2-methoxy-6-polyprenyl-1,4-benzoquinol methylase UbiE [Legionellales bacterium]|jgi:demethylmenaquinone methyltransferase / 2-methoxy-6-polyprenyl-1,4-benzoquinol methylase|nr:bifunctional demethylmenaquinone methyltransferase/2-methoxy-6-polyprenyl-1,4-benzoquinol methylase UbiE [Legionellales bacterium]